MAWQMPPDKGNNKNRITQEDIYAEIDNFLSALEQGQPKGWISIPMDRRNRAFYIMKQYELVSARNPRKPTETAYDITPEGVKAVVVGGIKNYLAAMEQAEKERQERAGGTNIHNTGTFIQGSTLNQSPFLNQGHDRPIDMPTQTAANSTQKSFWAKTLSWIANHIIQILIGLAATYIAYKLGWNK